MNEMRVLHVILTDDEALLLMEALLMRAKHLSLEPLSDENARKGRAGQSLMEKLGPQLFGKEGESG